MSNSWSFTCPICSCFARTTPIFLPPLYMQHAMQGMNSRNVSNVMPEGQFLEQFSFEQNEVVDWYAPTDTEDSYRPMRILVKVRRLVLPQGKLFKCFHLNHKTCSSYFAAGASSTTRPIVT